jgi:unspecific peroxygenase
MHLRLLFSTVFLYSLAHAFPAYRSLVGMTDEQIDLFARSNPYVGALPPPGPLQNTSAKLVNDAEHPYMSPGPDDIRGPCPGLNTLASHGVSNLLALAFYI